MGKIIEVNKPSDSTDSFDVFYANHYRGVVNYLFKKIGRIHDVEDLAADIFTYCFKKWEDYDPSKSSRSSWLYMIANSKFKNYCRDRKVHADMNALENVLVDGSTDVDRAIWLEDMRNALAAAIQTLPETQQQIVVMRYFHNKSSNEIAAAMGLSPGNVRVLLSRALDKLEKRCGEFLEGFK